MGWGSGTNSADFQSSGRVPSLSEDLNMGASDLARISKDYFRTKNIYNIKGCGDLLGHFSIY